MATLTQAGLSHGKTTAADAMEANSRHSLEIMCTLLEEADEVLSRSLARSLRLSLPPFLPSSLPLPLSLGARRRPDAYLGGGREGGRERQADRHSVSQREREREGEKERDCVHLVGGSDCSYRM